MNGALGVEISLIILTLTLNNIRIDKIETVVLKCVSHLFYSLRIILLVNLCLIENEKEEG